MNNRFCTDKPDQNLRYYIIPQKIASANSHIKSKISTKITAYIFFIKDNTITANPKKPKANRNLLSR